MIKNNNIFRLPLISILGWLICQNNASGATSFDKRELFIADSQLSSKIANQIPGMDNGVINLTHPPLVFLNPRWQWVGKVIKDPKTRKQKSSQKKMIWRVEWQIDPRYNWADGQAVRALDIKRTLEFMRIKFPIYNRLIKKIETSSKNPRTIFFEFRVNPKNLSNLFAIRIIPRPEKPEISYGPYQVNERSKNKIILTKNPFFRGHLNASKITFQSFQSSHSLAQKATQQPWIITANQLESFDKNSRKQLRKSIEGNYRTLNVASTNLMTVFFNARNPSLEKGTTRADIRKRIRSWRDNFTKAHPSFFSMNTFIHPSDPSCPVLEETLPSNTREIKVPRSLKIAASTDPVARQIVKGLKQSLKNEISLRSSIYPPTIFSNKIIPEANYESLIVVEWKIIPGILPFHVLHPSEIPSFANNYKGQNISGWSNLSAGKILTNETIGPKVKCNMITKLVEQESPFVPLFFKPRTILISHRFPQDFINQSYPFHFTNLFESRYHESNLINAKENIKSKPNSKL